MPSQLLRGERVRLTALSSDDLPTIASWHHDDETLRLFDAVPSMPRTVAQLTRWLADAHAATDGFTFAVRPTHTDTLIGVLQIDGILWTHGVAWLGILIGNTAERNKGYGSEAVELALRFAFHELNLHRIALTVFSYNTRAIAMYERIGFQHEGTHREFLERDGQRFDMLLYGLLRHDWQALRATS